MSAYTAPSERPTLPSLHTLNLLPPSYHRRASTYDSLCQTPHTFRRASTASSSRTPSPTPSDASSNLSGGSSPSSAVSPKLTLVPSAFDEADAVLVVPPPGHGAAGSKPLLLTGAALAHLRHPQRQIAKGTRLHPYRFARRPSTPFA
ncbi:hypothetical protein B0H15DRAFT_796783 [Mycena belliarum]|uniref:Uncharacterized protein n=1 Tax=Mycena belliarum TaxID=1033014 RepID=A0AAD6XXQ8_9AGAR|nr:hypothetical protein B0H15DRAFT_796783 [Mycena belliae]